MNDTILAMALKKSVYLGKFESQERALVEHLVKIFCIKDVMNFSHWQKEINNIFTRLFSFTCKSDVTEVEIKSALSGYEVTDGTEWAFVSAYCNDYSNLTKEAFIYTNGLKACASIPDILDEFVEELCKGRLALVENLSSYQRVLKDRGADVKLITLSELTKLKNKALK